MFLFLKTVISLALLDRPCSMRDIFSCGMWALVPRPGMNPGPLHQERQVPATGPPEESLKCLYSVSFLASIMPAGHKHVPCSLRLFSVSALPSLHPGTIFSRGCLSGTYCLTQNSLMRQLGINTRQKKKKKKGKDSNPFLHHPYRMKIQMYVEKE